MAGAVMPVILFTGIATGTLYMQSHREPAVGAAGNPEVHGTQDIETLNIVVVGMIALFVAIMLVNTLVAATTHRRARVRPAAAGRRHAAARCWRMVGAGGACC